MSVLQTKETLHEKTKDNGVVFDLVHAHANFGKGAY